VPKPCDVALIALSAPHVPAVIEQCGAAGIPFAIVLSAGFSEVGADGLALQQKLVAAAARGRRAAGWPQLPGGAQPQGQRAQTDSAARCS
jgi:acetyltransferase